MAKGLTLEQSFERLDYILEAMENGNASLNENFKLYKEGMKLIQNCNQQLDKVEKQIVQINDQGEQVEADGEF